MQNIINWLFVKMLKQLETRISNLEAKLSKSQTDGYKPRLSVYCSADQLLNSGL